MEEKGLHPTFIYISMRLDILTLLVLVPGTGLLE